jgi:hypothetical protein
MGGHDGAEYAVIPAKCFFHNVGLTEDKSCNGSVVAFIPPSDKLLTGFFSAETFVKDGALIFDAFT